VHAHGVDVFDGADDDGVVMAVAHHLELELLPAQHRLFQENLACGRGFQGRLHPLDELMAVEGHARSTTTQGKGGPYHDGKTQHGGRLTGFIETAHIDATRRGQAHLGHGRAKQGTVLGGLDGHGTGPQQLHAIFFQGAVGLEGHRTIERCLPPHGGQQGIGMFLGDDGSNGRGSQGFDIDRIGHGGIGHDGGRVGIDKDDPVTLLPQGLAGLHTGIIELARLADDDGSRTDEQDRLDVTAPRHQTTTPSARAACRKAANRPCRSSGPGSASGCP